MTDDDPGARAKDRELGIRVRSALRYNADRVVGLETDLRGSRRSRLVPALAAAACVLAIVAGGVTARSIGHRGTTAVSAAADSFVGRRWLLVSVRHAGTTIRVPAGLAATVDFGKLPAKCPRPPVRGQSCPGDIGIDDTINYASGPYRLTAAGFVTSDVSTTLVGWVGRDPVRTAVINALAVVSNGPTDADDSDADGSDGGSTVQASVADGRLTLTVPGWVLVLTDGGAALIDTSAPLSTSTP